MGSLCLHIQILLMSPPLKAWKNINDAIAKKTKILILDK